jgi:predicted nuclease of predicted toxin-antitoxin system
MPPDALEFWIDINLPPIFAEWIRNEHNLKAKTFRELNFENTNDYEVFKMQPKACW